jgi:hypothetical protein
VGGEETPKLQKYAHPLTTGKLTDTGDKSIFGLDINTQKVINNEKDGLPGCKKKYVIEA